MHVKHKEKLGLKKYNYYIFFLSLFIISLSRLTTHLRKKKSNLFTFLGNIILGIPGSVLYHIMIGGFYRRNKPKLKSRVLYSIHCASKFIMYSTTLLYRMLYGNSISPSDFFGNIYMRLVVATLFIK